MRISLPGRAVVLDSGRVISSAPSPQDRARPVEAAGVPDRDLWPAYQADRDRLDQGLISSRSTGAASGPRAGRGRTCRRSSGCGRSTSAAGSARTPEVLAVIDALVAGGTRVALLSNAAAEHGGLFRCSPLGALFERVFVSGELLLRKPDPAIHRCVAQALSLPPEDLVLVDDREANVRGAESIGIASHACTDPARLRAFFRALTG